MMNEMCKKFRLLIERSLCEDLGLEDRSLLDEHLSVCSGCRDYGDALKRDDLLLRDYVGVLEDDVTVVREAVLESFERGIGPVIPERTACRGNMMRKYFTRSRTAVGAVALAAVLVSIGIYSHVFEKTEPAFATVLKEIGTAENVSYRLTYRVEGVDPFTTRDIVHSSGIRRKEHEFGSVVISDPGKGKHLTLHAHTKKAVLINDIGAPGEKGLRNYLEWIRTLHMKSAEYKGKEAVDGIEANLFVNTEDPYYRIRVWADVGTGLPVRAEFIKVPNPDSEVIVPRLTLDKGKFGAPAGEARSISYSGSVGITRASTVVMDDFRWNTYLEKSLFSLEPPEGYVLEEDSLDFSEGGETDLVAALRLWTEMSDGAFPDDINDLGTQEKLEPLLIAAYDGDGDPEREFDDAMKAGNSLLKGCLFAQQMSVAGNWHYAGKGVMIGDAASPVCWWKPEDAKRFRIMYGNLRVEDIAENDLPGR